MSTHNEFKGRGFREAKWPGLIIATQDTELPKEVIETIKTNCKTSYEELIKNRGGEIGDDRKTGKEIVIDFDKLPAKHICMFGNSGAGKTYALIKLGNGGTTFDPCTEFTKLTDEVKDKLTAEAIKIIEKRKDMKR